MKPLTKMTSPPYYAVIFTSIRTDSGDNVDDGYSDIANRMVELANQQDGFLGAESARSEVGITVSYWRDLASIQAWKNNAEHLQAQKLGKEKWYNMFKVRIAKVEREYGFDNV